MEIFVDLEANLIIIYKVEGSLVTKQEVNYEKVIGCFSSLLFSWLKMRIH